MLLAGAESFDEFARDIFGDLENVIALIFSFQRRATNTVNRLALLVHYIVVFEKVFAGVEILRFYGFLRVLDAAAVLFGFDGCAFGHAEGVYEGFYALAA